MDIEENENKLKKSWSLQDTIISLFEKIKEDVEFAQAATTPISGGKVVSNVYLLILNTKGMEKSIEQHKEIMVSQKTWQDFENHF